MCISPPPPIQFSPINYTTIEGNFLIQPLQTMKRTSLKEVLLFEVVIEAAKAAATNRDRINAIRKVMTEQKIVDPRRGDQDVLGLAAEGREIIGHVLTIRDGKMIGGHAYRLKAT